jgi:predicted DNA-binding transcriptional regulator YafY
MMYILLVLLNKERVTAVELAKHFQVSVRTIYRDIESLNMAGIPIYSQQGIGGGFSILENYKLNKEFLNEKEIAAITSAIKGVSTIVHDVGLDTIIEKMNSIAKSSKETSDKELILDFSQWNSNKKQKVDTIKKAIDGKNVLSFNYTKFDNLNTERIVEPVNLIFKGHSWYLHAYCRIRGDFRTFRVSRIMNLMMLKERYSPRKEALVKKDDLSSWMNNLITDTRTIKLIMKFSPTVRAKVLDYFDETQIHFMNDGYMRVEVTYPDDEWTYGVILSFGADVEVLEPQYVRDIIKEKSNKIYNIYIKHDI